MTYFLCPSISVLLHLAILMGDVIRSTCPMKGLHKIELLE